MEPAKIRPPAARHPFFFAALLLGTFSLGLYLASAPLVHRLGSTRKDFGWEGACESGGCAVRSVRGGGPAEGRLAPGDRILAVRGDTRLATGLWLHLHPIPAGTPYSLRIARGASGREVVLEARLESAPAQFHRILLILPVGLTFLVAGLVVGTRGPEQAAARLLSLAFLAGSLNFLQIMLLGFADQLRGAAHAVWVLAALLRPFERVLGYHFLLHFPGGLTHGRGWRILLGVLYAWAGFLWARNMLLTVALVVDPATAVAAASALGALGTLGDAAPPTRAPLAESFPGLAFLLLVNTAVPALALWNYGQVVKPDQLRRIRWVLYSVAAAFLPVAFFDLAVLAARALERLDLLEGSTFRVLSLLAICGTVLMPVILAYAVLKHRLLDVDIVIRRGLQYLLARNVLRLTLFLPGAALGAWILRNPDRTLADIVFEHPGLLLLIAAAGLSLRFRGPLTEGLDRRFFRASYDREHLLLGLIEEIKARDSIAEISRLACERVDAALHLEGLHFFYRPPAARHLEAGYSSDEQSPSARIPETSDLLRVMDGQVAARDVPFSGSLAADEATWLEQLGVSLVVPIPAPDRRLAGLLLLGAKKSEEPFSRTDRRLLEAVAAQIGIVWDNAVLRDRVDRQQRVQQEVLQHLDGQQVNLVRECPVCRACYDTAERTCRIDGAELALTLPVERTIHSRYRLDRLLGRGGMGAVYEAADLRLGRQVAVKVLTGSLFGNPVALRRFEREARAVAQLSHPSIITVHDYGELTRGGAYLVMELLPGATLRREIETRGTIPPPLAAAWFDAVFEGVKAAHAAGVIHRDLKPENVLIGVDEAGAPCVKVLDFGLAKVRLPGEGDTDGLTVPGAVLGTLRYMSPEQLGGEDVDERTDVFALGVMLAEALTGRHPFPGGSPSDILAALLVESFHLPGDSEAVRALDAALQRCLAKHKAERLGSIAEMQAALGPWIARCPPFPPPAPPPAA